LDLVADKLLIIITLFYFISYESSILLIIPSILIIIREIVISAFRQLLSESEGKNPIKVTFIAKSKTTLQIFALSFLIISPNFGQPFFFLTILLFWLASYVSLHSLYGYIKTYQNLIK
jgi:CDP-diacylglycerol--glycerol-3-phosphate 3-phosphatidyltransferase